MTGPVLIRRILLLRHSIYAAPLPDMSKLEYYDLLGKFHRGYIIDSKFPFRVSPLPHKAVVPDIKIHLPETNLPDSMSLSASSAHPGISPQGKEVKDISNKPSYHCQIRLAIRSIISKNSKRVSHLSKAIQKKLWESRLNATNRAHGLATCPSQIAARRLPQCLAHGFNRQLRACSR